MIQVRVPYFLRVKEGSNNTIPHLNGLRYRIECFFENLFIKMSFLPKSGLNSRNQKRSKKIIVSLTTYPERINVCFYAIKSLMLQSMKPDRIVLWLSKKQFEGFVFPNKFNRLFKKGLEIQYCEDLKSHKKYYYCLQEQKPNEVVITYDDDIIYERQSIEKLYKCHLIYPNCIICNRAHMILKENGALAPIEKWPSFSKEKKVEPYLWVLPSTGNGCLYPYNIMPEKTFDIQSIMKYALFQDDLWICFNHISNGVKIAKTEYKNAILINVAGSQTRSLTTINDIGGENNRVIKRLNDLFPNIFDNL